MSSLKSLGAPRAAWRFPFIWMGMADLALIESKETAKAAQAFADYVALGPSRSLRGLAEHYAEQGKYKTATTAFSIIGAWSGEHHWQQRLKDLAAEQIGQATDHRLQAYVRISGEYSRRVGDDGMLQVMPLNSLHGIYDRVRPKESDASDSSSGGSNVTIQFAFIETMRT